MFFSQKSHSSIFLHHFICFSKIQFINSNFLLFISNQKLLYYQQNFYLLYKQILLLKEKEKI